jgi:hypothetical protein
MHLLSSTTPPVSLLVKKYLGFFQIEMGPRMYMGHIPSLVVGRPIFSLPAVGPPMDAIIITAMEG